MRYYDTAIKNEIHEQDPDKVPATAIPMTDARVSAFFEELPLTHKLTFDSDNLPIISEIPPPSAEAQAEYDSKQYARDRAEAYPSLTEQADMAYWDRQNGTTTLDDTISAVKAEFPKG
jgi:hypothetical protein